MKRLFFLIIVCTFVGLAIAKPKAKKAPIRVACIGNSITYGTGIADREKDAYPVQLQQLLGDGYVVGNFGKPGATLLRHGHRPYVQQKEWQEAKAFKADIAVIHLGINDTDPRNWPNYRDEFILDYCALIDTLRMINPQVRILIAELTPLSHRHHRFLSGTRDWREEITKEVGMVAKAKNCQLVDFFTPLYTCPDLLTDGIHPNAEGAGLLAKAAYEGITGDYGGLQMPAWYSDNMMMQRGEIFHCRGKADAGEVVTANLSDGEGYNFTKTDTASIYGDWFIYEDNYENALKAGKTYTLTISTKKKTLTYKNILAGDIWICSGQSNMAFTLSQAATAERDVPNAKDSKIRLLNMTGRWATNDTEWPEEVLESVNRLEYMNIPEWTECTPETAAQFSAVAYYFGKNLRDSLDVPIGLVCNAVGGTPIEAWIDRNTIEHDFPAILNDWTNNDFIQDWVRGRAKKNIAKATNPLQRHPYEPCYMYEAGMLPLEGLDITGFIWYQGESNAHNYEAHEKLFPLLTTSLRQGFGDYQEVLPLYFVQLSSLNRPSWPWFRDSQRKLAEPYDNVKMAVTTDLGDSLDVHPKRKAEVGYRLALQALYGTYNHKNIIPSGPEATFVNVNGNNQIVVDFNWAEGLTTSDGKAPTTFEVANADEGIFYPAEAVIEGNTVVLTCKELGKAYEVIVRYGWQPFTRANLTNKSGLPASTFRISTLENYCSH